MLWLVAVCLVGCGVFASWLALRFRAGQVPRSWQAGTWPLRHATSSETVWREANALTWWLGLVCGVILLATGLGLALLVAMGGADATMACLTCTGGLAALAVAIGQLVATERCAKRLQVK